MLKHWVAASLIEGVGPAKIKKLLEEYGSIEAAADYLRAPLDLAEKEIEAAEKMKVRIFSIGDPDYPPSLKQITIRRPCFTLERNYGLTGGARCRRLCRRLGKPSLLFNRT